MKLSYRGGVYRIEDGAWRGPDGHTVHLLTWITDDLAPPPGQDDAETARRVAERLGEEAHLVVEDDPF